VTDVAAYKDALPALGEVWRRHFGGHYPAMGLFGVVELFEPAALVELMGVAVVAG
jgi:enamine deaminase RidA (YjgF/YER057c/UK114 family)